MALTPSQMLPLGTPAPAFALTDAVTGRTVRHDEAPDATALVVLFICNHCPFVIHVRDALTRLGADYADRGVRFVAINSNSLETHPQDGPGPMKALATELGWSFPYCFDETQAVAKAYRAACTPDAYVFDGDRQLAYRGQLDDSRPGQGVADAADVRAALDAILDGRAPSEDQRPSMGCNIKWAPGNAPAYFG